MVYSNVQIFGRPVSISFASNENLILLIIYAELRHVFHLTKDKLKPHFNQCLFSHLSTHLMNSIFQASSLIHLI